MFVLRTLNIHFIHFFQSFSRSFNLFVFRILLIFLNDRLIRMFVQPKSWKVLNQKRICKFIDFSVRVCNLSSVWIFTVFNKLPPLSLMVDISLVRVYGSMTPEYINKGNRELSLCHKFCFQITISLEPSVAYLRYFKLWILWDQIIWVWNIKGLQHRVLKILWFKYLILFQKLNPFVNYILV